MTICFQTICLVYFHILPVKECVPSKIALVANPACGMVVVGIQVHLLVALVFILLVFINCTSILHWLLILIYVAKMTNIWCVISFVLSNVFAQSLLISSLPWCSAIETMATSILPISFPNDKEDDQLAPLPTYLLLSDNESAEWCNIWCSHRRNRGKIYNSKTWFSCNVNQHMASRCLSCTGPCCYWWTLRPGDVCISKIGNGWLW